MSDIDPTYVPPPVMPSPVESAGGVLTREIERQDLLLRMVVNLKKAVIRLMLRDPFEANNIVIGALEMDHTDPTLLDVKLDASGNLRLLLEDR